MIRMGARKGNWGLQLCADLQPVAASFSSFTSRTLLYPALPGALLPEQGLKIAWEPFGC